MPADAGTWPLLRRGDVRAEQSRTSRASRAKVRTIGRLARDFRLGRCCGVAQPRKPEHSRRLPWRGDGIPRVILLYPPSVSGLAAAANDLLVAFFFGGGQKTHTIPNRVF